MGSADQMRSGLIIMLLAQSAAAAGWVNYPLTASDWYDVNGASIMGQVYTAMMERVKAGAPDSVTAVQTTPGWPLCWRQTVTLSAGSNMVTTNVGGVLYTNWYQQTITVTLTNHFGPYEYTWPDYSGYHTWTGFPFVASESLYGLCDWWYFGVANTYGADGDTFFADRWINTNYYDASWRYAPYMATNDGFPVFSLAGLMALTGAGRGVQYTTNANGHYSGGRGFWLRYVGGTPFLLGEWKYLDGAWKHTYTSIVSEANTGTDDGLGLRPLRDIPTSLPVVRYDRFTARTGDSFGPVSVSVTGAVIGGLTNVVLSGSAPPVEVASDYQRASKTETVIVSATNTWTACVLPWASVSGIGVNAAGETGDVIVVTYTNEPTQWMNDVYQEDPDLFSPNAVYRLWGLYLNHLYTNVNKLTACDYAEIGGPVSTGLMWQAFPFLGAGILTNQFEWTGLSTVSWAAAKSACEAASPVGTWSNLPACRYTAGWRLDGDGVTNWTAKMITRCSSQTLRSMDTSLARKAQFYVYGTAGGSDFGYWPSKTKTWDNTQFLTGPTKNSNTWYFWEESDLLTVKTAWTCESMSILSAPSDMWCDAPTGTVDQQKGWTASRQDAALDFAVSGGMTYR